MADERTGAQVVRDRIDADAADARQTMDLLGRDAEGDVTLGSNAESAPAPPIYAQILDDINRDPVSEQGGTGLKGAEPYGGWLWEEFLPKLRGLQGAMQFKEMAENDGMCGAVLYALNMLMRNVAWTVEPADIRPESIVAAERIQSALFNDMEHSFGQLIEEASSMLTYGFAPHEVVYKRCRGESDDQLRSSMFTDNLLMPASIPIRSQETIWRWVFDNDGRGRILGFEQFRMGAKNAIIPIQKAMIFRTESRRNNPEGRSILRNAFIPYMRKKTIEEAEGRLALRSAGIVVTRIPAEFMQSGLTGADAAVYGRFKQLGDSLAQDRAGSVVLPSDRDDKGNLKYSMEYLIADSRKVQDFSPIIDRHDSRIAISVLADFLLLGTKNVGSWALADTKTSLFVLSVEGYLGVIAEVLNQQLLRKIWRLNQLDPTTIPKLTPGSVQKPDLDSISNFVSKIVGAGAAVLPSSGRRLENALLAMAKLPRDDQKEG